MYHISYNNQGNLTVYTNIELRVLRLKLECGCRH